MMNELQRLNYLEALGIQQWVAKAPLPHAKESEFVELAELLPISEEEIEPEILSEAIQEPQLLAENPRLEIKEPQRVVKELQPIVEESQRVLEKPQLEKENAQSEVLPEKSPEAALACAFQIQGKRGQYLLLADLQDAKGKINLLEQNLLNNISKAIDSLLDNTSTRPILPEQFKWPMFESHFNAEHIDQGQAAAKESLGAFLYSNVKKHQISILVVLGTQAQNLLDLNSKESAYKNIQFVLGASLSELSEPNVDLPNTKLSSIRLLKAELWEQLKQHLS